MNLNLTPGAEGLRTRLFHIIFESDTPGANPNFSRGIKESG